MAQVVIDGVAKQYGGKVAVLHEVNLTIADGELLCILGPSGCGKTTLLRIIAGLIEPDQGEVLFDDRRVTDDAPERRETAMVFQSYALFPHMTVAENVGFGLRMAKRPAAEIRERVQEMLDLVGLGDKGDRQPRQLSGGQQQRVALARALVMRPKVLLCDEPLSNLDTKLRERMRFEIKELQRRLGITTVYVTHDQSEALVLADRVAVMKDGNLLEVGRPIDIYTRPRHRFTSDFLGVTNFLPGKVVQQTGAYSLRVASDLGELLADGHGQVEPGTDVVISVRPENIKLSPADQSSAAAGMNVLAGSITDVVFLGNVVEYRVSSGGHALRVQDQGAVRFQTGDRVTAVVAPADCLVLTE